MRKLVLLSALLLAAFVLLPVSVVGVKAIHEDTALMVGDSFLVVDDTVPYGQIVLPTSGSTLDSDVVEILTMVTDGYDVTRVKFAAWYNGGWQYLGVDLNGSDGFGFTWDVSEIPDQTGIRISAQFFDSAGNHTGETAENLTLARDVLPTATGTLIPTNTPTPTTSLPEPNETTVIYGDALATDWQNWSWYTILNPDQTAVVKVGEKALAVNYRAPWAGVSLYSLAPLYFRPDDEIHFWIKGTADQSVSMWLVTPNGTNSMRRPITFYADRWVEYSIPLRNFGDYTTVQRVIWQDQTGTIQPVFYLDDVAFHRASGNMTPTPMPTPTTVGSESLVVYGDTLASGWRNWSWSATVDFAAQNAVYAGTSAVAVDLIGDWGGLYLGRTAPLDLTAYGDLRFWIYGNGQAIDVKLVPLIATQTNRVRIIPPADKWSEVVIPLSAFGEFTQATGLVWQDGVGSAPTRFYVDDITFSAGVQSAQHGTTLPFEVISEEMADQIYLPLIHK